MSSPINLQGNDSVLMVVETIEAVLNKSEDLKKELLKLIPNSREQSGCLLYEISQNCENSHQFTVIMHWRDLESYNAHGTAEFIKRFEKNFEKVLYLSAEERVYRKIY